MRSADRNICLIEIGDDVFLKSMRRKYDVYENRLLEACGEKKSHLPHKSNREMG
ncbi:MAG: hypothetical protein Q8M12_03900 [bacterium]|nr:hypothetical protein [bacterium]